MGVAREPAPTAWHNLASYLGRVHPVRADNGLDPLPEEGREDQMILFLGLARGIVGYLGDHGEAFDRVDESRATTRGTTTTATGTCGSGSTAAWDHP